LISYKFSSSSPIGIWATTAERTSNRPTTSSSSSYGRVSQPVSFVSGGIKTGSKIEKKKSSTGTKKKPILIESYDTDEDSDEKLDDDDDDDEIEVIEKKRKRRGDISEEDDDDDDDDDSDIEEIQDESNQPVELVKKKILFFEKFE
jgi:hypothetical protein